MAEFCQLKRVANVVNIVPKPTSLFIVTDHYLGHTMATIFDDDTNNDVVNIEDDDEEEEEEEDEEEDDDDDDDDDEEEERGDVCCSGLHWSST